jgi:CDI immunity protein
MNQVVKAAWAEALSNNEFVCIETRSGYRSNRADPKGAQHLLSPEVSEEALGNALLDSLERSRFVVSAPRDGVWIHPDAEFDSDLYDAEKSKARYEQWKKSLMDRYGYKTPNALFKGMKSCSVERRDGLIKLTPMHHESLDGWGRTKGDGIEDVVIPSDSSPARIGAALRLAFSRCTE